MRFTIDLKLNSTREARELRPRVEERLLPEVEELVLLRVELLVEYQMEEHLLEVHR